MKHTKGKWEKGSAPYNKFAVTTTNKDARGLFICTGIATHIANEADAKLIAAAPELLQFAQHIEKIAKLTKQGRSGGFDYAELQVMAKEAIKKATE